MLKVSDAFNSAFAAPDRELHARVTIGKTVYDSDDLTSINYDSGAMTGEQFSIGSTYMNSTKITFSHLVEGLKQLDEVLVEFGVLKPDGAVEYVKMGTFIVDDKIQMDRNNNTTTIECMDRMTMLGGAYVSKLTYPARIKDVAVEIVNMAGVKANETSFARLSENKINQPTGYTYRDAIGLIAQFQMGFALFDRDGLLDIRTLQDNSFKIDPNQYFLKGLVKNETFFKLNGISCTVVTTSKDENGNETSKTTVLQSGSSSGAQIKLANNVMTQDVLDRMYEALKFTNYYPFSLNWNGNPAVEAGDWLTVEDLQGNEFKVPNMSYTLTYNGGLTATSKADTSVSSPATYSYGGTISNIVNEIGGRESAEGNHIYEGTEDQEPTLSKEGDLWYKHVGPDTEERIYKDGKWEFLTSTKTANDAADAADKASKEAEEAKKQANKAVDGANDAVAKAGFANDTADQAKSDAATAGQQAKDALTSAGTAITDAQKALTNSSSAMADSDQARKDSATAIKDAADSLTSAKDAINKVGNLTTSVTSQFTTVNNELKSKVNQTDYDKLKGTVTTQQTEINQNASGIKLKADKSYTDTINNSVVKNTSSIGLLNNQIALTVSKAELNNTLSSYATQTWTQGQIKTTADSINLSVSKVQSGIDNLNSGDRNLILGSANWKNLGFYNVGGFTKSTYNEDFSEVTSVGQEGGPFVHIEHLSKRLPNTGDTVIISVEAKGTGVLEIRYAENNVIQENKIYKLSDSYTRYYLKVKWVAKDAPGIGFFNSNKEADKHVTLRRPKIVVSSVFNSDWSPAPEDSVTDVEFAELAVKVDGITATVDSKADKTQITQLSDQIKLKADTTALNELKGTVDKQGSEITLNTNSIKLKADQSSVDTLKGTVDKQGSAIDVNTKAIALKASQSTVDTLTGRVSTAEGKITVQADQISQTVSKTELTSKLNGYATQTWSQGQISVAKNEISTRVETVKQTVANLKVPNRNYALNTGSPLTVNGTGAVWQYLDKVMLSEDLQGKAVTLSFIVSADATAIAGDGYIVGQYGKEYSPAWLIFMHIGRLVEGPTYAASGMPVNILKANTPTKFVYRFTMPTGSSGITSVPITLKNVTGNITISHVFVGVGNTATDWSPAPEDMASQDWTKSLLDVSEGKVSAQVQSVKTDLTNTLNNNIANATAGMATQTWTQGKLDLTADGLTSQISSVKEGLTTQYTQLQQTLASVQLTANNAVTQSQYTQLADSINLRVQKGDVINQINISPENILIAGQKVHITGQTSIDNAVIKDAMIANVTADKITAGTLNAANVNMINLNANNITTGTIKGANLSLNLNTGEVLFQKGSIKSANGNLNIHIDDGSMSLTNSLGNGAYFKDGNIYMTDSDIWTPGNPKIQYGTLKMVPNFLSDAGGGVALKGPNGVVVGTDEYPDTGILGDLLSSISGGGITLTKEHIRMASEGDIGIAGGKMYNSGFVGELPGIQVGIAGSYTAPMPWFPSGETGDALFLSGKVVGVVASNGTGNLMTNTISDLSASCDARSGYVLSAATYKRTYGSGDTVTITPNGVFGRISSASKYKLAIGEISTLNDEAHQFLSVKPKQWFDKSESEALADSMTTGNTDYVDDAKALPHNGFIAEDLYTAGLDSYVIRSNDGSIESIQYDRLPVLHHELIRELFNRLDAAEMEIYKLKQEVLSNAN